jgi:hypothetical protein
MDSKKLQGASSTTDRFPGKFRKAGMQEPRKRAFGAERIDEQAIRVHGRPLIQFALPTVCFFASREDFQEAKKKEPRMPRRRADKTRPISTGKSAGISVIRGSFFR